MQPEGIDGCLPVRMGAVRGNEANEIRILNLILQLLGRHFRESNRLWEAISVAGCCRRDSIAPNSAARQQSKHLDGIKPGTSQMWIERKTRDGNDGNLNSARAR